MIPVSNRVTKTGVIDNDEEWLSSIVYHLEGTVWIMPGVTITIQPGTTIVYHGVTWRMEGDIIARGTADNWISFVSPGNILF